MVAKPATYRNLTGIAPVSAPLTLLLDVEKYGHFTWD
jgi:hypothetical protein